MWWCCFFFQAEDGIRDLVRSRGLGDVYKRQVVIGAVAGMSRKVLDPFLMWVTDLFLSLPQLPLLLSLIHI